MDCQLCLGAGFIPTLGRRKSAICSLKRYMRSEIGLDFLN